MKIRTAVAVVAVACILLLFASHASRAAEAVDPARTNEWTIDCGTNPQHGQRYCVLQYLLATPDRPAEWVLFGIIRQLGVEAVFLQTPTGFSPGSRVWIRVDDLPAREFAAPRPQRMLQDPQPTDPVAVELAKGIHAVIAFQPLNGQRRTVQIPLEGFLVLFERLRAEVP